jgi:putative oxidoreductase
MDLAANRQATLQPDRPGLLSRLAQTYDRAVQAVGYLTPVLDLGIRLLVAEFFFASGLTKIASWDVTVALFESEYAVPLLAPELAAYLGAAAELSLPVLLALGLSGRFAALALFVFNIVAVISYPGLSEAGLREHQHVGLLLLVTLLHGPGKLSIDHFVRKFFARGGAR